MWATYLLALLLLSGDVELNPGPPRRAPASTNAAPKGPSKEEQVDQFLSKAKEYEEKFEQIEQELSKSRDEISTLRKQLETQTSLESKISGMKSQMDAITETYDELHEKMHEIDKTRKNNLLFYGVKPDFYPEIPGQLDKQIHDIFRFNLGISREIPLIKLSRMISGPEVRGCKPVLVNFLHWKDREEVLRLSKLLKGTNIYVTEDLSRKMREQRSELNKFMRTVRSRSPQKKCVMRQDKLYIDNDVFIFDEEKGSVVPMQRFSGPNRLYYSHNINQQVSAGLSLVRSASVHSVGSHGDEKEALSSGHRYASTESLDFRTDKIELPREKPDLKVNGRSASPGRAESPNKDGMPTIDEK